MSENVSHGPKRADESVSAAFDRLAPDYDAWYTTPLGAFVNSREKDIFFKLTGLQPGERMLDAGCGTGDYALALARKGAQVIGMDLAPAMLAVAASKAKATGLPVDYSLGSVESPAFPADSFDLVVSVTVLEFAGSPRTVVAEMMRVLRPGGRLVVGVLNAWSLWAWAYHRQKGTVFEQAHFLSPPELLSLLRPYGPVTWQSCVFVSPWHSGRPGTVVTNLERFGSTPLKLFGAFLAARVEKRR